MALVALLSLSLVLFSFSPKNTTLTQAQCQPDQRHALIQLKKSFNTTELHSWNASTDCCKWAGITCDEQTGMVTALNLYYMQISGNINPALFNLSSLRYLDLSWNDFHGVILPQTEFERLDNLTHLDLSFSGFVGQVPRGIFALTNLIYLDLSIHIPNTHLLYLHDTGLKTLLSNLTKLQVLYLDGVDISLDRFEWGKAVFHGGSTLQELSMSYCGLGGNFPDEIFHLTNITYLDLSYNSVLSGQLPKFTKEMVFQYLSLKNTNFSGPLPDSIGNLQYLLHLDLLFCYFYGEIPSSITNLTRLKYLDLNSNRLTGTIPLSLFSHPSLEYLDLVGNQLSGQLSISRIIKHSIYHLDLSYNKLSIIEEKNHNESFYASFPQLQYLGLASSNLKKFPSFLSYQTNIYHLDLSNNSLTGEIPLSICNLTLPTMLDLSYNNLTGTIPPCLLEYTELEVLNLRSNKLSGPLPQNISQACGFKAIYLSENLINGSLPILLMHCNSLEILDMGDNQIVNRFPYWLGRLEYLRVLVLRSNMFYGQILDVEINTKGNDSIFPMLKVLDLSSNHFSGTLPTNIFVNLKAMMSVSNTSSEIYFEKMNVSFLPWVASIPYKGPSFDLIDSLGVFSYIDLSNNEFLGRIPEEIGQLKSLFVLNLSHNALTGLIPLVLSNLEQLDVLDLSSNQLTGPIPQELTSLTFLSALNLSYNNLLGQIPEACQFSTFSNASYMGNPRLCGSPLTIQCVATPSNDGIYEGLPSKSSTDIIGFSVSIGLGLGVGFAFIIWATISWEIGTKWFNFIIDKFYFRHFH